MLRVRSALVAALCAAAFSAALAAAPDAPKPPKDPVIELPVTASVEVENDQAVVELYVLEENADVAAATNRAVERAAEGLDMLKTQFPQAELKNLSLTSTPRYSRPKEGEAPQIAGWQVRQSIRATLSKVHDAAAFVQSAQKYFSFDRVGFQLSPAARQSVQGRLVRKALDDMNRQAQEIARSLGGKRARVGIESVRFHEAAYAQPAAYRMNSAVMLSKSADTAAALPVFEPGTTTLQRSLTVRFRVQDAPKPPKVKAGAKPEPKLSPEDRL